MIFGRPWESLKQEINRCEYHALCFHEVAAFCIWAGPGMLALLGDLVGAFPKAWRELIIVLANKEAKIQGSRLVLMRELLRNTAVEVSCSGNSVVDTWSGLPESGLLGPVGYPLLPRLLDKSLEAAGAGIAVDVHPNIHESVRGQEALRPTSAAALSAIDATAVLKLHILLIADDQILPASNIESLRKSADLADAWASMTGQEYHVDKPDKTAVLLLGQAAKQEVYESAPIMLGGKPVPSTLIQKWCGIIWDAWLSFIPFLEARVAAAWTAAKPLIALARKGSAPVAEIRAVMTMKVEGVILFGSMFLCLAPHFEEILSRTQTDMERSLLEAPPWVPGVVIRAIAGWSLS
jgi:hypothetical protein